VKALPAICFEGVSFAYGANPALVDADFDVYPGDYVCVVGPNGGGKTTLLKLALGLLKPDRGRIRIFGETPEKARGRIGYVPQQLQLDPAFPVRVVDVVLMGRVGRRSFGFASREDRRLARAALARVELEGLAERPFGALSGGQRQAVLIARALAGEASVILLDEPDAHIDPGGRENLLRLLDGLPEGITRVLVSHDMDFVAGAVEKVICVDRQVHLHPTGALSAERLERIFGRDLRLVRHDRDLPGGGGHGHARSPEGKGGAG